MLASTLCTIHNERFIVSLVDRIRASIDDGTFDEFKTETSAGTTAERSSGRPPGECRDR